MSTGAYLFGKVNGKRKPIEVEYLTKEERVEHFKDRPVDEILRWLDLTCNAIIDLEIQLQNTEKDRE